MVFGHCIILKEPYMSKWFGKSLKDGFETRDIMVLYDSRRIRLDRPRWIGLEVCR